MAQRIVNVKAGDKFIVNCKNSGFEYGIIVESITEIKNISSEEDEWIRCKYISGKSLYKNLEFWQRTIDLKRYKGKIK